MVSTNESVTRDRNTDTTSPVRTRLGMGDRSKAGIHTTDNRSTNTRRKTVTRPSHTKSLSQQTKERMTP